MKGTFVFNVHLEAVRRLFYCRARMFTFDQKQYPLDRLRAFVDGCVRARAWAPQQYAIANRGWGVWVLGLEMAPSKNLHNGKI